MSGLTVTKFLGALLLLTPCLAQSPPDTTTSSLPDTATLLKQVIANGDQYAKTLQRYICRTNLLIDPNHYPDSPKNPTSQEYESFYINGKEIQRLLTVNRHPLSAAAKAQEEARVQKEIDSDLLDAKPFRGLAGTLQGSVLTTAIFTDEQRIFKDGRSYITFNFHGNHRSHPDSILGLIAKSLKGNAIIDEKDLVVVEINGTTQDDVVYNRELMVPRKFPVLIYNAKKINDELYVPSLVSIEIAARQDYNDSALIPWNRSLERRTYMVESCRKFRVTSRILPSSSDAPAPSQP